MDGKDVYGVEVEGVGKKEVKGIEKDGEEKGVGGMQGRFRGGYGFEGEMVKGMEGKEEKKGEEKVGLVDERKE